MKKEERYEGIPLEHYDFDGNFLKGLGYGILISVPLWIMIVTILINI